MTLPDERTRNLLQAGAFLKELAGNRRAQVRAPGGYRLLHHYPTLCDVEAIAQHEEQLRDLTRSAFVRPYLMSQFEQDLFRSYPRGPDRI